MLTGFSKSRPHLVNLAFFGWVLGVAVSKGPGFLFGLLWISAALYAGWWLLRWARWRNAHPWAEVAEIPPTSARVACVGRGPKLKEFAQQGPIRDEFFEVFSSVTPFALRAKVFAVLVGLAIGLMVMVVSAAVLGLDRGLVALVAGTFVGGVATSMLWPTILRITPGKLEVLERTMLNTSTLTHTTFDLRQSAVLVDLNQEVVFIARDGRTQEVWIKSAADPHAIAAAILRAAVSTHVAPALPDDAIIG